MATKFISPSWRMPRNSNQSKASNYSIDFDGALNSEILLGNSTYLLPGQPTTTTTNNPKFSASIFFQFKSSALGAAQWMVGSGQGGGAAYWSLRKNTSNTLDATFRTTSGGYTTITGGTTLSHSTWYHACVTWDGDNINLYLNGTSDATQVAATTFYWSTNGAYPPWNTIGSFRYGGANSAGNRWQGKLTQVSIFDYGLDSNAVATLWGGGIPGNPLAIKPPIAYYDLGQGSAYASGSAGIVEPNLAQATGSTVFDFSQNKIIRTSNDIFDNIVTDSNKIGICTISYWFKNNNAGAQQDYMSLNDDNVSPSNFRIDTSNRILYMSKTNYMRYPAPSDTGGWNHHCWVFNSNTSYSSGTSGQTNYYDDDLKFYLNGVEQQVNYNFSAAPNNTAWNGLNIAESAQASGASLNFEMSNLQLFNTNLSSTNVSTLYNNGTPLQSYTDVPQSGSLKAWYKLGLDTSVYNTTNTRWAIEDSSTPYNGTINFQI